MWDNGPMPTFRQYVSSLLGVSAFQPPGAGYGLQISDSTVDEVREAMGGNIQPLPSTRLRWYLKDLERAQGEADNGFMRSAAQLCASMQRDGVVAGLLKNQTAGLVRLPKRMYGNTAIAAALRARAGSRSVFDEMLPPAELGLMVGDGIKLGLSVGEFVPVQGRSYPVLTRLEPEFLQYRWVENRWYFSSTAGALPITPGDGRWVLHCPGGRLTPWRGGAWPALGRSFINKEHALLHRSNYSGKLANPARLAFAPLGATESERVGFFKRILAWATNTVIEMPPGWDAKLLESNGRGWDVFQEEINTCDHEYMVTIEGQTMTTTGGEGFANGAVGEGVQQTRIQDLGESLAYTINTQMLPQFALAHFGAESLNDPCIVEYDTKKPADLDKESRIIQQIGQAIDAANAALRPYELRVDAEEICIRFDVPTEKGAISPAVDEASPNEDNSSPDDDKGTTSKKDASEGAPTE